VRVFSPKGGGGHFHGWSCFVERSVLQSRYLANDGMFVIVGAVKVVPDDPPCNLGSHLGLLLDSTAGSNVSFVVDGERFAAHRAVLQWWP
jgi:speckle-type POZ protein